MTIGSNHSQQPRSVAIVIPAWKPDFLNESLECLVSQVCQDFHVYIGDDASPYALNEVVAPFLSRGNFTYHKFETNFGGHDLVAQWTRCIELTQGEELIWLFSDDDRCSPNCIDSLLRAVKSNPRANLFHFGVQTIDEANHPLENRQAVPLLSAMDYLERRIIDGYSSFVVEYV